MVFLVFLKITVFITNFVRKTFLPPICSNSLPVLYRDTGQSRTNMFVDEFLLYKKVNLGVAITESIYNHTKTLYTHRKWDLGSVGHEKFCTLRYTRAPLRTCKKKNHYKSSGFLSVFGSRKGKQKRSRTSTLYAHSWPSSTHTKEGCLSLACKFATNLIALFRVSSGGEYLITYLHSLRSLLKWWVSARQYHYLSEKCWFFLKLEAYKNWSHRGGSHHYIIESFNNHVLILLKIKIERYGFSGTHDVQILSNTIG